MYLITVKEDHRIIAMGNELDYLSNGYPRLVEDDVAFPTSMVDVYEVEDLPDYVEAEKYCYDGSEFSKNEDYKPYISDAQRITNLELALAELYESKEI